MLTHRVILRVLAPLALLLLSASSADAGDRRPACGGDGQRACCVHEEIPSCDSGLKEKGNCNNILGDSACQCGTFAGFPIYADGVCADIADCGDEGERACCLGEESFGPCRDELIQDGDCQDEIGTFDCFCPGIGSSDGVCIDAECGGEGERACCLNEQIAIGVANCEDDLIEVEQVFGSDGCAGDCACRGLISPGSSSGMCHRFTPCGGEGERACCVAERIGEPCDTGLLEVPGCSGDCFCGAGLLNKVNDGITGTSSSTCVRFEDITEPQIGWTPGPPGQCDALICRGGPNDGTACTDFASTFACRFAGAPFNAGSCRESECSVDADCGSESTCVVRSCSQRGYADLHMHLFAHLAHGGAVLAGEPSFDDLAGEDVNDALQACFATDHPTQDADGISLALDNSTSAFGGCGIGGLGTLGQGSNCPGDLSSEACDDASFKLHGCHGVLDEAIGSFIGTKDGATFSLGGPAFSDWPQWTSTTHQQAYYRWLERAWRGGLRLMVQLAVTNGALCKSGTTRQFLDDAQTVLVDCDDSMASIDQQLQAAYDFQDFIDRQVGGGVDSDSGWFRIVTTPFEAREEIARGNMAVVLGIEMANLFNCKFISPDVIEACTPVDGLLEDPAACEAALTADADASCDEAYVRAELDRYYDDWGVRHVFPIHNFDNAFGGTATWQDAIEVGNRVVEGHWYAPRNCLDEGFRFRLGFLLQTLVALTKFEELQPEIATLFEERGLSLDSSSLDLAQFVTDLLDGDLELPFSVPGPRADCNTFGLFPLGEALTTAMMEKGMIIDVDHLSTRSLDDTISLAQGFREGGYPMVASHALFFDLHKSEIRHERMRTASQLAALDAMGSMLGVMLKDDVLDTGLRGKRLTRGYSSSGLTDDCRHSSKTFAQAYRYAVDTMSGRVGMGSDFHGVAGHFGPRFGSDACGGNELERSKQLLADDRLSYPFTLDQFGEFGKQVSGQKTFDYNVHGLAHVGLLPDFLADVRKVGLRASQMDPLFRSAEAYIELWERARGETTSFVCEDADCAETDTTPPSLVCPAALSVECTGPLTPVFLPEPTAAETCSVASTTCPAPSGFPLGSTDVDCLSVDLSGNESSCTFSVTSEDTAPPSALCRAVNVDLDATGNGLLSEAEMDAGSGDRCGPVSTSLSRSSYTCNDVGVTIREALTVTDASGNSSTCTAQVFVADAIAPTASCQAATVFLDALGGASISTASVDAGSADACGASLSLDSEAFTCADVGANTVSLTATDPSGNSNACTANVTVVDALLPVALCKSISVTLEQDGTASVPASAIDSESTDACGVARTSLSPNFFECATDEGDNPVVLTVTDANGNASSCNATVTVLKRGTTLVYQGDAMGQYSDGILLKATLTDAATGNALAGKTINFTLGSQSASATTDANGVATVMPDLLLDQPATATSVVTSFAEDCTYLASSDTDAFEVETEDASVSFDEDNPVAVNVDTDGGDSPPFSLTIYVNETLPDLPDDGTEAPGDIAEAVLEATLAPVGPGTPVAGTCGPENSGALNGFDYAEVLRYACAFDGAPVNAYTVEVALVANASGERFYTGAAEDVLVVFDPSLGFTTGGGWFRWPGTSDRTNFGYTMKYGKKGMKPKGSLLLIRHREGGGVFRVKSNVLRGLALNGRGEAFGWASFSGKATYKAWDWDEPVGNHEFLAYVEDHGEPGTDDRFWIRILDQADVPVAPISMDEPAASRAVRLEGGNLVVPHTP